jgi:hypothetical protein
MQVQGAFMTLPYRPLVRTTVDPPTNKGARCRRCGNIPFRPLISAYVTSLYRFKCHVCSQPLRGGTLFLVLDIISYIVAAGLIVLIFALSDFITRVLEFQAHYFIAGVAYLVTRWAFCRMQMRKGKFVRA